MPSKRNILILSILLLLALSPLLVFIVRIPSFKLATPTISHDLASCLVTKEGNPLVESLSESAETIQVNFKGKITGLEVDPVINSRIIKLTSLDESQTYSFNIRDATSSSALKTDQTLLISFICDKKSNGFKFTKIQQL